MKNENQSEVSDITFWGAFILAAFAWLGFAPIFGIITGIYLIFRKERFEGMLCLAATILGWGLSLARQSHWGF